MKTYRVVGGLIVFAAFGSAWLAFEKLGWKRVYVGAPSQVATMTACDSTTLVNIDETYYCCDRRLVCVRSHEYEQGTLKMTLPDSTDVLCFGVKGENWYTAATKNGVVEIRSLDRVIVP